MQTTAVNLLSLHTRYDALGNHMGIMYGCTLDSAFVHQILPLFTCVSMVVRNYPVHIFYCKVLYYYYSHNNFPFLFCLYSYNGCCWSVYSVLTFFPNINLFWISSGQFSDTSLQQWNGYRGTNTSMLSLKGLSGMAGNLYCLLDSLLCLPTSSTTLYQPRMLDFLEIFFFPQLSAAYQWYYRMFPL